MILTFQEWLKETGAIYDGTDSPDFNWWGAVGVDKGDYSDKPLETDVNHPKKKHKHKKHKDDDDKPKKKKGGLKFVLNAEGEPTEV